jgi:hypothetical protein
MSFESLNTPGAVLVKGKVKELALLTGGSAGPSVDALCESPLLAIALSANVVSVTKVSAIKLSAIKLLAALLSLMGGAQKKMSSRPSSLAKTISKFGTESSSSSLSGSVGSAACKQPPTLSERVLATTTSSGADVTRTEGRFVDLKLIK